MQYSACGTTDSEACSSGDDAPVVAWRRPHRCLELPAEGALVVEAAGLADGCDALAPLEQFHRRFDTQAREPLLRGEVEHAMELAFQLRQRQPRQLRQR